MDPDETLKKLRALVEEIREDERDGLDITDHEQSVLDLFDGLDQWLTKGGFLPAAWAGAACPVPGEE